MARMATAGTTIFAAAAAEIAAVSRWGAAWASQALVRRLQTLSLGVGELSTSSSVTRASCAGSHLPSSTSSNAVGFNAIYNPSSYPALQNHMVTVSGLRSFGMRTVLESHASSPLFSAPPRRPLKASWLKDVYSYRAASSSSSRAPRISSACGSQVQRARAQSIGRGPSHLCRSLTSAPGTPSPPSSSTAETASKEKTYWDILKELSQVHVIPLLLGLSGAVPFIALAPGVHEFVAPFFTDIPLRLKGYELDAQIAYGACIASFLGAVHWGLAIGGAAAPFGWTTARYVWGVTPSLGAWLALLYTNTNTQLAILGSTILAAYGVDLVFASRLLLPPWYMALRLPLTVLAVGSLSASLAANLLGSV